MSCRSAPPLRERIDDINDLVQHFLRAAQRRGEPIKTIAPNAIKLMQNYSWPGNVRELENLVRRLSALYADETISVEIVQSELNLADRQPAQATTGPVDVSTAVKPCRAICCAITSQACRRPDSTSAY